MTWAEAAPVWVTIALALAAAVFILRRGGGAAIDQLVSANRVLERRVKQLEDKCRGLAAENALLRAKTDLAEAFKPVQTQLDAQHHEALERSDRILDVLGLIAERLGPDAEAA